MAGAALRNPIFKPAMREIDSITQAINALVTTTFAHGYLSGEYVRLYIPLIYGMQQANQKFGKITVASDTSFTIDIDTSKYDAFIVPSPLPANYTCAQVVPIGEEASMLTAAVYNTLSR